jgi:hypothetical protein
MNRNFWIKLVDGVIAVVLFYIFTYFVLDCCSKNVAKHSKAPIHVETRSPR